jgi:hypothetical protein
LVFVENTRCAVKRLSIRIQVPHSKAGISDILLLNSLFLHSVHVINANHNKTFHVGFIPSFTILKYPFYAIQNVYESTVPVSEFSSMQKSNVYSS